MAWVIKNVELKIDDISITLLTKHACSFRSITAFSSWGFLTLAFFHESDPIVARVTSMFAKSLDIFSILSQPVSTKQCNDILLYEPSVFYDGMLLIDRCCYGDLANRSRQ